MMEPISPSVCRRATRNADLNVKAVAITRANSATGPLALFEVQLPGRDRFLGEANCQAAALPQGRVVGRRIRDPVTRLRDVVAALGIDFEWHDITPRSVTGTAPPHSYPGNAA